MMTIFSYLHRTTFVERCCIHLSPASPYVLCEIAPYRASQRGIHQTALVQREQAGLWDDLQDGPCSCKAAPLSLSPFVAIQEGDQGWQITSAQPDTWSPAVGKDRLCHGGCGRLSRIPSPGAVWGWSLQRGHQLLELKSVLRVQNQSQYIQHSM